MVSYSANTFPLLKSEWRCCILTSHCCWCVNNMLTSFHRATCEDWPIFYGPLLLFCVVHGNGPLKTWSINLYHHNVPIQCSVVLCYCGAQSCKIYTLHDWNHVFSIQYIYICRLHTYAPAPETKPQNKSHKHEDLIGESTTSLILFKKKLISPAVA